MTAPRPSFFISYHLVVLAGSLLASSTAPPNLLSMFDTRMNLMVLIDYKEYYGEEKGLEEAHHLLAGIPSITLLNYISGFGAQVYLHENSNDTAKVQSYLIGTLLSKCPESAKKRWQAVMDRQRENGSAPMMFWTYSNLIFYGLIFKNYNMLPVRDLEGDEAMRLFDAYLLVNLHANTKLQIEEGAIAEAASIDRIEDVIMPNFIYQKDYASSTDFTNQVVRGVMFFEFLESSTKYKLFVHEYYASLHVTGYRQMFQSLIALFSKVVINNFLNIRQLLPMHEDFVLGAANIGYVQALCINEHSDQYSEDLSFSFLRNHCLFDAGYYEYLLLDINFLFDHFYKAQVFSFGRYLKSKKFKGDFLSDKAKNFAEKIYLPFVINDGFPLATLFFGDDCRNSAGEELCDAYIRQGNKVCLIEFKDVMLNSTVKNSANKEALYTELSKKFVKNQNEDPKGLTQLWNAVTDIDNKGILFDSMVNMSTVEIYPVIIYTDGSFGVEGISKRYKEVFHRMKTNASLTTKINDITFINLNFFELRSEYLAQNKLNLFTMLDAYHLYTINPDFALTPFEVFSRFYIEENQVENLGLSQTFLSAVAKIRQG